MVHIEEAEEGKEPTSEEEREAETEQEKKDEYLHFRRQFDKLKHDSAGAQVESTKLKDQGNNFFKLGLFMQASMMYSEALELQPTNAVLYCNRSMAYLKQDMPHEALADAEESLKLVETKENIKAYWRKAQALLDLGRSEESEEVADAGLALQASNEHINRVRRKAREVSAIKRLIQGDWVCKASNGIEKRYTFAIDGSMKIHVFGQFVAATYELSAECTPRCMRVAMKPEGFGAGTGAPPPAVPYIFDFKLDDKELWLCSGQGQLPTEFAGPGFEKYTLVKDYSNRAQEETSDEPLDVRCARYIEEMKALMPVLPPQLPAQPSDADVSAEIQVMEQISQLKRRYGMLVHQRALELAKDPISAGSDDLAREAMELQRRFVARKILDPEKCFPWPPPKAKPEPAAASAAAPPAAVAVAAKAPEASTPKSGLSCLAGITRCCSGGQ